MKNIRTILIVVLLVAVLVFVKIKFLTSEDKSAGTSQQGKLQIALVTACVAVEEKLSNKIIVSGSALANEEVMLVPETSGKITAINFKEGSKVAKGALLVKINDADLQAQLKKLQLQEKLATENEAREKKMLDVNGISQAEYDAVLSQLNTAKADIELTQAQISKTEIRAPFDGSIGLKNVSEGSFVNQSTAIASIQQTDPLKIDFFVPQKYSSLIDVNDTLDFTVEGNREHHKAAVFAIEPKVDVSTRSIHIRAMAPNRSGKVFPGSFVSIEFPLGHAENSILISSQAIIPVMKGQKVFISRNGMAQEAKVQIGFRSESKVQILDGIQKGDTIITSGIMGLKAGTPLKIISINK